MIGEAGTDRMEVEVVSGRLGTTRGAEREFRTELWGSAVYLTLANLKAPPEHVLNPYRPPPPKNRDILWWLLLAAVALLVCAAVQFLPPPG
jgi:hypothetical protein